MQAHDNGMTDELAYVIGHAHIFESSYLEGSNEGDLLYSVCCATFYSSERLPLTVLYELPSTIPNSFFFFSS